MSVSTKIMITTIVLRDRMIKKSRITFIMQDCRRDWKESKINGRNRGRKKSKKSRKESIIRRYRLKIKEILTGN
jgi:hypothetical protein